MLGALLREAGEAELAELLATHWGEIDVPAARQVLRNPFVTAAMIERLAGVPELVSAYELRRESAFHPRCPRVLALRFVATLYWADLLRLGLDPRVHPAIRRAAELRLIERLAVLSVGEKMAVARAATPGVIAALRADPTPRVVGALLENPRLTEALLAPLVASASASPLVLALVAASPRWAVRTTVRYALCRNPATPLAATLPLLPLLAKRELEAIANDVRLLLPVRRRAQLLSGGGAGAGRPGPRPV
jgi:hypothetical protein